MRAITLLLLLCFSCYSSAQTTINFDGYSGYLVSEGIYIDSIFFLPQQNPHVGYDFNNSGEKHTYQLPKDAHDVLSDLIESDSSGVHVNLKVNQFWVSEDHVPINSIGAGRPAPGQEVKVIKYARLLLHFEALRWKNDSLFRLFEYGCESRNTCFFEEQLHPNNIAIAFSNGFKFYQQSAESLDLVPVEPSSQGIKTSIRDLSRPLLSDTATRSGGYDSFMAFAQLKCDTVFQPRLVRQAGYKKGPLYLLDWDGMKSTLPLFLTVSQQHYARLSNGAYVPLTKQQNGLTAIVQTHSTAGNGRKTASSLGAGIFTGVVVAGWTKPAILLRKVDPITGALVPR